MIEILPGVFYDPAKEWYEQDPALIELALQVEQTTPVSYELETEVVAGQTHQRLLWGEWEHATSMGLFRMRVDMVYLYPISHRAFLSKYTHNQVSITAL